MAKSSKKRKEKSADFKKAKLKLGKGKQAASNAVDTSFKARSIVLPGQSIVTAKDDAQPLTKRKQSLDDLLTQLKHYGATVRRDALNGIQELIEEYPSLLDTALFAILSGVSKLIADEDHSVRRTLQSLLRSLFDRAQDDALRPHAHILLLFTASALTHIFPEIRVDAIRVLDVFLQHIPEVVTAGWDSSSVERNADGPGRKLLQGYLGLLNLTRNDSSSSDVYVPAMSSVILSSNTRSEILNSLSAFLESCLGLRKSEDDAAHNGIPTECFEPFFSSASSYQSFIALLNPSRYSPSTSTSRWIPRIDPMKQENGVPFSIFEGNPLSINDIEKVKTLDFESSLSDPRADFELSILETLQPLLSSVFVETAPIIFSPVNTVIPESDTRMLLASLRIGGLLYTDLVKRRASLQATRIARMSELLLGYLGQIAAHFPFTSRPLVKKDVQVESFMQEMNFRYCELVNCAVQLQASSKQRNPPLNKMQYYIRAAMTYLSSSLAGESGVLLTAAHYRAVIPSLVTAMAVQDTLADQGEAPIPDLYNAILQHDAGLSTQSSLKRYSTELIARLVLLGSDVYRAPTGLRPGKQHCSQLKSWLTRVPRVAWETKPNLRREIELLHLTMLRVIQRSPAWVDTETLTSLCTRLVPYFVMNHAQKGPISGPFSRLGDGQGDALRLLCLDVVETLLQDSRVRGTKEGMALRSALAEAHISA